MTDHWKERIVIENAQNGPFPGDLIADLTGSTCPRLMPLLEGTGVLVGVYDPEDRICYANAAFRAAYFVETDENLTWQDMIRRNYEMGRGTVLNVPDLDAWITSVKSRRGKEPERYFETDLRDGRWFWACETVTPEGWMLFTASEITALRTSERALRQDRDEARKASQTDDLTGISNRRHIMDLLTQVIAGKGAVQVSGGCACLMDLDHFKRINDAHGHQTGDLVLSGFARLVRDAVRLADGTGRVGGEEFLLVMPGTTLEESIDIVTRIFQKLAQARLVRDCPNHLVTVSAGLTEIVAGDTAESVYRRSDLALYEAKQNGRNQLRVNRADTGTSQVTPTCS